MNKGSIVLGVAVALLGSGLLWAAGSKGDSGIAGWETLNVSMEQAIGVAEPDEALAAEGSDGNKKDHKQSAGKAAVQAEGAEKNGDAGKTDATGKAEEGEKVKGVIQEQQAVQTSVAEKGTVVAGQNATGRGIESGGQTQTVVGSQTPIGVESQTAAGDKAAVAAGALEVSASVASQEGKINVNTAGAKELMDLPDIGEKKAQAIIDYRNREGAFRSLSDLGKVKGIGPKMLEKLKPLVIF
ncbi:ComEA family DNA-binding protein [Paenibacillus sp. FSL R10-2734]|uniref:ComEA family DNA-binding protein n=1 Tax=Paenibacillus sp. FSL R10-2734 TaxID=2954691 RepID=UPI0030D93934